ncbi:hypothetical protein GCM10025865_30680 [Paraoerskovia sediminicola]|uniref:Virulence factor MviN n=1 Tax=Paraoerskovia sediminicola TaxID=1138587 RepID=A0ABM8G6K0_9CELL|nr:hypothetical protein GCM10025865_30680 [Paraoerskovia sediminicola]
MSPRWKLAAGTLAGAAALITVVNLASRLIGFLRQIALVSNVGPGEVGDIYLKANTVPNVMFEVAAGGALAGAIVPLLAGPVARRARIEASGITSALLTWALVVLVPVGALMALAAPWLVPLIGIAPGESADLATYFLRVFALQIPLYGVGTVMSGVLQANRRFFWPAAAPILSSAVVITTYVLYGASTEGSHVPAGEVSSSAVALLAWGTTAGVAAMSLPLVVPAWRTGIRLRLTLRFPGARGGVHVRWRWPGWARSWRSRPRWWRSCGRRGGSTTRARTPCTSARRPSTSCRTRSSPYRWPPARSRGWQSARPRGTVRGSRASSHSRPGGCSP